MSSVLKVYNEKKIKNYKLAFEKFSSATDNEFKYEWAGDSLSVLWNDTTYLVSHVNDLKAQYRRYFERKQYNEIFERSCALLWQEIITKELDWQTEDIIIDLYNEWRKFLDYQKAELKGGQDQYEKIRRRSWEDLQVLFELAKLDPGKLVRSAERINEYELVPLIAMAMVKQFGGLDEFIDVVVKYVTEVYYNVLTPGHVFEKFNLSENEENGRAEIFYVYEADFEFLDIRYKRV